MSIQLMKIAPSLVQFGGQPKLHRSRHSTTTINPKVGTVLHILTKQALYVDVLVDVRNCFQKP